MNSRTSTVPASTKHTPGPWTVEFIDHWPFGVRVVAGDKGIVHQDAYCHSTAQKTREDCERGEGFAWNKKDNLTTRDEAAAMVAEQDANARLIAAAPELLDALNKALAYLANPQAFDTEGLWRDWIALKDKAEGQ